MSDSVAVAPGGGAELADLTETLEHELAVVRLELDQTLAARRELADRVVVLERELERARAATDDARRELVTTSEHLADVADLMRVYEVGVWPLFVARVRALAELDAHNGELCDACRARVARLVTRALRDAAGGDHDGA